MANKKIEVEVAQAYGRTFVRGIFQRLTRLDVLAADIALHCVKSLDLMCWRLKMASLK
ncbi:hypothetical protein SAMN02745945_02862 [Peptoclostridium litorale DSM 5388]|uniref:Uncharacterized protein n=1 Tax=Peptoclostridium litorale DSM 5388 TaxID=1121324 RepID=A0A069RRE5_PEPLI|nr:hypothetical protein [Peptoclostridium litorale]KDR96757.1 hypothetical protein CLIT_2c03630 [Peptoclostridium litorale DSM 5388]SIO34759.1 hypothetical protein SAMN02745945_02862 [Peptoclostridium litorale DSM 5388]